MLATQLDFKLIARLEFEHARVGLANHEVAVELDLGTETEFPATLARLGRSTEINPLSGQKGFVERGEVEALRSILLGRNVSAGANKIGLADIAQLFDFGE